MCSSMEQNKKSSAREEGKRIDETEKQRPGNRKTGPKRAGIRSIGTGIRRPREKTTRKDSDKKTRGD